MAPINHARTGNLLLDRLSTCDFSLLQPFLQRVPHRSGDILAGVGDRMDRVWFPAGAVTALLAVLADGRRLAIGLVGREGMVGSSLLHGVGEWRQEAVVRAADSSALRIESSHLLAACRQSETLRDLLLRFAGNLTLQISATSISNLAQKLMERMARWILLYHDRVGCDELLITHEEFGIMLGVRRASATEALHVLEGVGAIRCTRGRIVVLDRSVLKKLAGETYEATEEDYWRRVGPHDQASRAKAANR